MPTTTADLPGLVSVKEVSCSCFKAPRKLLARRPSALSGAPGDVTETERPKSLMGERQKVAAGHMWSLALKNVPWEAREQDEEEERRQFRRPFRPKLSSFLDQRRRKRGRRDGTITFLRSIPNFPFTIFPGQKVE